MSHEGSAPPTAWIDALLASDGQALLQELAEDPPTRDTEIARITQLRERYAPALVTAAVEQTALRRKAESKFSNAQRMYFTRAGLEQASSERMARHHARRYTAFDRIADLCTGIGGDLIGLAAERAVLAVDVDPVHARLSQLNAAANDVAASVTTLCADVRDVAFNEIPAVFIDPARRSSERRFTAGASEPSLAGVFRSRSGVLVSA